MRIPGVTPAAVTLINCYIEIFQRRAALLKTKAGQQSRYRGVDHTFRLCGPSDLRKYPRENAGEPPHGDKD